MFISDLILPLSKETFAIWGFKVKNPTQVIIFGSAGALCCLIIVCVVLCACRPVKTAPIVAVDEPSIPPLPEAWCQDFPRQKASTKNSLLRPSIREVPQPESMDTGYYSWKERWDQSRQNQGAMWGV